MNAHKIQPLPSEVAAKIKSSTSITHLNGVIVELVKNALDANAHSIYVTVDYRRGGCIVEDDGDGILPTEFEPQGGVGKAHHTSKLNLESPVYGRKGCFLASLSSLALLTVTSHHGRHASTNTVIFHHSTPVARLTPAPRHQALKSSNHGTRVTVNDLFGNMPVRVKTRALTLQKPDELDRQWDDLRHLLVSFMISNNSFLKLVVSDADKERKLTIRPRQSPRNDGEMDTTHFNSIISQAGLIDTQNTKLWHAVSAKVPNLAIHAALSLVSSPSKKVQFISLGIDPIFPHNQSNILYSEINRLFAMSDFGTPGDFSPSTAHNVISEPDGHRSARPLPKAVNKWPMFYIRIDSGTAISNDDQELPESDKSLQHILDVLTLMINEYLKEHKMCPRGGKRKRQTSVTRDIESPAGRGATKTNTSRTPSTEFMGEGLKLPSFSRPSSRPSVGAHFGSWSRVKSGHSQANGTITHEKAISRQNPGGVSILGNESTDAAIVRTEGSVLDTAVGQSPELPGQESSLNLHNQNEQPETDKMVPWIDPYTGKSHWINSRTGQSVNVRPSAATALANRPRSTGSLMATRVLDNTKRSASAIPQQNTWLENLLDNWNNPVFSRSERLIDALGIDPECENADASAQSFHKHCGLDNFGVVRYHGKLRKQDLGTAKVMGQVDQKFILVEMQSQAQTSTLALIDQHAADERCRVERLFEELFAGPNGVQAIQVDPIVFDIPANEAFLFKRQADFLRSWGIEYVVEQDTRGSNASVSVSQLPTLIAERCRTEPDLIVNIIRDEIWKRSENGGPRPQTPATGKPEQSDDWIGRLAGCPQGILDLLNSRACRTAIMFNDVLSIDECQNLVRRLASCVFPFQCAHGRPSVVPLVDLRGSIDHHRVDDAGSNEGSDIGFIGAFERWQSK
ncbi:hypothetical protein BDW59DRAFT_138427 [Aspergillus cavernicola]|uniref:MutL C-terminal dimerisation domain-containing protein n=1 Tax=Aspergillus cavernicola TaxID=176166 RepID=A0ABR4J054_9EURO